MPRNMNPLLAVVDAVEFKRIADNTPPELVPVENAEESAPPVPPLVDGENVVYIELAVSVKLPPAKKVVDTL